MLSISFIKRRPSDKAQKQIIDITAVSASDLSLHGVPESNCLFELYSWLVQTEVLIYTNKVGALLKRNGEIERSPYRMVLARTGLTRKVVGFLLLCETDGSRDECGVNYMAVHPDHRRQGIGQRMIRKVVQRYPHTELTCHVPTVGFYEKAGFQAIDTHFTQVAMCTRPMPPAGNIQVLTNLLNSEEGMHHRMALEQRFGQRALMAATREIMERGSQLTKQAQALVSSRLSR